MLRRPSLVPILVVAAAVLAPAVASAATHSVSTWTVPMTAVTIDAEVGDDVTWSAVGPGHTVDYLPGLDGQDLDVATDASTICASLAGAVRIDAGGTATVNLTQAGTFYYVCAAAFPLHCNNGMRVRVNVTDSAVSAPGEVRRGDWGRVKAGYR
jgi:plastocyanin